MGTNVLHINAQNVLFSTDLHTSIPRYIGLKGYVLGIRAILDISIDMVTGCKALS